MISCIVGYTLHHEKNRQATEPDSPRGRETHVRGRGEGIPRREEESGEAVRAGKGAFPWFALPTNAEIHEELARLIATNEEDVLPERLLRLRLTALSYLDLFAGFSPYLVGSVLSGAVTSKSDIDIHLFSDSTEAVENLLEERGIAFQTETVPVRKGGIVKDYTHIYLEDAEVVIECSVYPANEKRNRTVSSITGKPMERAGASRLKKIIAESLGEEER
ncbi:nucleotidyltransferase [Geoanaerobacter pelophilus]|uniref:Nucleotidyltransferase n=1 Tax=Geoanaerobacter pelophilus TaxID=60036 RepID=A0ABQ0MJ69_9BACT|nr:nucleotidyltransferase [Geoanaerobacter pelophilus]